MEPVKPAVQRQPKRRAATAVNPEAQETTNAVAGGISCITAENSYSPMCPRWAEDFDKLNKPAHSATKAPHNKPEKQIVKKTGIRLTSVWPGTSRGWGPITRRLAGE
jgi:hypothetical protein